MKTNEQKNSTKDSFEIPVRISDGVSGPSREMSKRHEAASGAGESVKENNNAGKSDTSKKIIHTAPRLAERRTGLRELGIGASQKSKNIIRQRTEQEIHCTDPEVMYVKAEWANRDLVCTLMERQDRLNEAIFLKINDPGYRIDDLEERREEKLDKRERGNPM